jgi:Zn-dependent protease with chaperone function
MARKMGIELQRIYVVPAGRGHLTNAFAGMGSISLTDNLGQWFDRQQIDFVIAHELAHIRQKHGIKSQMQILATYTTMTLAAYWFRQYVPSIRPLLDLFIILVPLATFYFFSRRNEYEADQKAVEFTGDPKSGIRALTSLYRHNAAPTRCGRFAEVFQTHPALQRRAEAIGGAGEIPPSQIIEILNDKTLL